MDGPREYHTKWSKSERERQILYDITYMQNLKYDRNEKQKQIHRHRKQIYGYQRGKGLGEGWIESLGLADKSYCI